MVSGDSSQGFIIRVISKGRNYDRVAYTQFWYNWGLLFPAFCVGLLGGAVYHQFFKIVTYNILTISLDVT